MDSIGEVDSFSQSDSISSVASSAKLREDAESPEEQLLLQLLQRAVLETTEENAAYSVEISGLLSKFKLEQQLLPSDIRDGLQKVSLILKAEKVPDLDETTMCIARERKKVEEKKRQREEKKLGLLHDDLIRKYTGFARKLEYLQDSVVSLEDAVKNVKQEQENCYSNRILLFTKLKEYRNTVEKLEKDLGDMEVENLYPEKILNKYEKYLELTGELAELNQCLGEYRDLPPNLLQAKALLEAKQKEYESVEKAFIEKTNSA